MHDSNRFATQTLRIELLRALIAAAWFGHDRQERVIASMTRYEARENRDRDGLLDSGEYDSRENSAADTTATIVV